MNVSEAGSWASSPAVRRSMIGNRNRDTRPELVVRSLLHRRGMRFRVAARPIKGLRRTADIVFRPAKTAVQIDGCYWHGCPDHYKPPRTNPGYWSEKIVRNTTRDRDSDEQWSAAGWIVLHFWEHESPEDVVNAVAAVVASRRASMQRRP